MMNLRSSFLTGVAVIAVTACGGGGGGSAEAPTPDPVDTDTPDTSVEFDYAGLLTNLADTVIAPAFNDFNLKAGELDTAVDIYCDALGGDQETAERANVQQAWQSAIGVWQQIEVMQVGPLIVNSDFLRNNIYTYELNDTCAVDQEVVYLDNGDFGGAASYDISLRQPNRRGLDALEYLLFTENGDHTCAQQVTLTQAWNALAIEDKRLQRCNLVREISDDLVLSAAQLVEQWENDFRTSLINAGETGSEFPTALEGVNAISDAMFYIDTFSKDLKIAKPLGIQANSCNGEVCTQDLESQYAFVSRENIVENLTALQRLYLGNSPGETARLGFDDMLIAVGEDTLAATMAQDIQTAIDSATGVNATLKATLENDVNSVQNIHGNIKSVTDQMKTEFIEKLQLSLPATAASDND